MRDKNKCSMHAAKLHKCGTAGPVCPTCSGTVTSDHAEAFCNVHRLCNALPGMQGGSIRDGSLTCDTLNNTRWESGLVEGLDHVEG